MYGRSPSLFTTILASKRRERFVPVEGGDEDHKQYIVDKYAI